MAACFLSKPCHLVESGCRLRRSSRKVHERRVFSRDSGNGYPHLRAEIQTTSTHSLNAWRPFDEVQEILGEIASARSPISLARQNFAESAEAALNEQINVEYNVSYVYHALFAYFDRDNVGLPGLAKFFERMSKEERDHAEALMEYQNVRGGKVKLQTILMPPVMELESSDKGDALHAMELALSLEKLTNEKLLALHKVADASNDPQMADFIESNFLNEQVESIKQISEYVSQLRRVGKGHGVYHFDLQLQKGEFETLPI